MKNKNLNNITNSGFKVPDNYFEGLEYSVLSNTKLNTLVSDSGFKTPEGYFDDFKVSVEKETKVVSLINRRNILYISSIAAAIALFFSLTIFNNSTLSIASLDTDTLDTYILDETNLSEIASLFQEQELEQTQFTEYTISDEILDIYLESVELEELISN